MVFKRKKIDVVMVRKPAPAPSPLPKQEPEPVQKPDDGSPKCAECGAPAAAGQTSVCIKHQRNS